MTATMESLGLDRLSKFERLSLLDQLWDSIDRDDGCLTDRHLEDLQRRELAYLHDPLAGSLWEDIKAKLGNAP